MLPNKSLRIKNHIINNMQDPVKADVVYMGIAMAIAADVLDPANQSSRGVPYQAAAERIVYSIVELTDAFKRERALEDVKRVIAGFITPSIDSWLGKLIPTNSFESLFTPRVYPPATIETINKNINLFNETIDAAIGYLKEIKGDG